MKRLKIKYAHKLAWWFRRWAEKLEPTITIAQRPQYRGKEYDIHPLRVAIDRQPFEGKDFHDLQIIKAKRQIGDAIRDLVEVEEDQPGPGGYNRTILQLIILTPCTR